MSRPHCGDASLPSCLVTFVFLQFLPAGNGKADFRVLGPPDPLLALVGQDKELPCKLSPNISAEGMELRWYRDQPSPAVHVYRNGKDVWEEQMEAYRGRTTLTTDHVARGEAAVRIHNVTLFDNGTYHCIFKEHTSYSQATLWLRVAGLGSAPRIHVIETQDNGIQGECTSAGWFPEPKVEWQDLRGRKVPAVTHFSASATGLLAVTSTVAPQDGAVEGLTCSISNPLLPGRKVAKSHLPAPLSERSLSMERGPVLPLILIALGLVTAAIACVFGKRQRDQHKSSPEGEAERGGSEQSELAGGAEAERFHVSLSLDPDTASPKLLVSEDQKSVKRLLFDQDLLPNSRRFERDPCVLAQERFWSGRHYWEVEVGDRRAWILGVCLESLGREERIPKSPQHGLWAVELYKKKLRALSYPRTRLSPLQPLRRVGIFLDCEAGEISFHNITNGSLVYTFSGLSFPGPLQPFFCLWTHDPNPLTICSVVTETQEDTVSSGVYSLVSVGQYIQSYNSTIRRTNTFSLKVRLNLLELDSCL
ncbi:butyrophilin-like protein 10 [Nannospalax galili]|uniref:butyrophilin-like protein 10 n=1 Tax=Nannospalax galili TaxID=1026970 RepID=UPI00111C6CFA|nr:butyrophilin-like protein 10 [Nannospalax galili]